MAVWAEAQVLASWTSIIYAELLVFITETVFQSGHQQCLFPKNQNTQSVMKIYE